MDELIGSAVMLSLPGYVALQWYVTWKWDGGWRIAAFVPMAIHGRARRPRNLRLHGGIEPVAAAADPGGAVRLPLLALAAARALST